MKHTFSAGQIIYLVNGEQAEYVSAIGSNHIVRPFVRCGYEDDEFYRSDVAEVDQVFADEPVALVGERIKELNAEETATRTRLEELHNQISTAEQEISRRQKAFSRHRALDRLDDFIEGRITHVVHIQYGKPSIMTLKDALHIQDSYDRCLKLVTLYGDSKGNLNWHLDHYSDGSGSSYVFLFPFLSEDAALQHALKLCDEAISDWRNKTKHDPTPWWSTRVDPYSAAAFIRERGLSVPEDIAAEIRNMAIRSAQEKRDNYARLLSEAEEAVAALTRTQG
jgi:hypothetical protein